MAASLMIKYKKLLFTLVNWWPPYAAAGIQVTRITKDLRELDVAMKIHSWNKNILGTHFGGSMYSMVDPWYMLMLHDNLGKDYIVWDKSASINFRNPGLGTISAKFRLTEDLIAQIRAEADRVGRVEPNFRVEILDAAGKLVAEVNKVISVRRKDKVAARQIQRQAVLPDAEKISA